MIAFDKCPWCGTIPKATFPDVDGGCTLRHPIGKCPILSGSMWLFATPEDAAEAWNRKKKVRA